MLAIITLVVYFILLILISLAAFKHKEKRRRILKPFFLSLISILFIIVKPTEPLVYIAFIFALIGDILILFEAIFKKPIFFPVGAIAFFVSHILNLVIMILYTNTNYPGVFNLYYYIGIAAIVVVVSTVVILLAKKYLDKLMTAASALYYSPLFVNLIITLVLSIQTQQIFYLMFAIGMVFFIVSDFTIFKEHYYKEQKYDEGIILSTYFVAEFFIAISFLLMLGIF